MNLIKLIDLSQPVKDGMPSYPGDPETKLMQSRYLNEDGHNNFTLETCMHSGTHIDSPMHLTGSSKHISEIRPEAFIGTGYMLDVRGQALIQAKPEYGKLIKEESIVLLYTEWDKFYGAKKYYEEHPCIDIDFCRLMVKKRVKMLGIDFPSPDRTPFIAHKFLLENNIFILENLTNLGKLVGVKDFEIIALPLKIKADSSMTRAVARII
jgi:kynurenine formamidase